MKFLVSINMTGLPTTRYSTSAEYDFKEFPGVGDLLFANESISHRSICFRDGRYYDEYRERDMKCHPDRIILAYDDFEPGVTPDEMPDWHKLLKERIISVTASCDYGSGQNITVTEDLVLGCAKARIRHQQAPDWRVDHVVYCVRINATGPNSLRDSLKLHGQILRGGGSA